MANRILSSDKPARNVKNKTGTMRSRKWTEEENELYAKILSSDENSFASSLERLALKNSSNNEVFLHIKRILDCEIKKKEFKTLNEMKNLRDGKNTVIAYDRLDTSLAKLRKKYTNLKSEWRKITDRAKSGSGLAPLIEPKWYAYLNEVFAETNEELLLAGESADLSFVREFEGDSQDEIENKPDHSEDSDLENVENPDEEDENVNVPKNNLKAKLVAAPHIKRKAVRSQNQALSNLAHGVEHIAASQMKRHRLTMEADLKRDEMFLKYKQEEAEKNREHEYRMAQLFANAIAMSNNRQENPSFASYNHRYQRQHIPNNLPAHDIQSSSNFAASPRQTPIRYSNIDTSVPCATNSLRSPGNNYVHDSRENSDESFLQGDFR